MKNILFASTALVAFAGAAAADVDIKGRAEIGVVGGKSGGTTMETQFHTDIDIDFEMSGETDNGLTFGASLDIDEVPSGLGAADDNGVSYFVAFGNARLDMGDTDGGFDAGMQEVNVVGGSINDAETLHAGFSGNSGLDGTYDGQIARFSYSTAGFGGHVSVELDDTGAGNAIFGLGATYATDLGGASVTVGLGYQSNNTSGAGKRDIWGVSAKAAMTNGITGAVNYSVMTRGTAEIKHTAVGVGYTMNNIGLGFNWGQSEVTGHATAGSNGKNAGWGLAATYDMGGGMVAQFGYGANTDTTALALDGTTATAANSDNRLFSLGLAMSF